MESVDWDAKEFLMRSNVVVGEVDKAVEVAVRAVAQELLRLSQLEVPLDKGRLMGSGTAQKKPGAGDVTYTVSYNTVYAHRLHEHPEYKFQRGRKGKYLEDPLKRNYAVFNSIIAKTVKAVGKL